MPSSSFPCWAIARSAFLAVLALLTVMAVTGAAHAQVAEVDVRSGLFLEPSSESSMRVLTPAANLSITPFDFLSLQGGWAADVVSGASESIKAGPLFRGSPDIVSAASVTDLRQVLTGGVTVRRDHTELGASYTYGTENDYKSHAITARASTDFFQRNTRVEVAFAHGFDEACDLADNRTQVPTARQALDESKGCFSDSKTRRALDVSVDNFQGSWTQSWTPVFATQLVLTGAVQRGFLSNPYRSVAIGPSGEAAQEHHPRDRSRGAAALRLKYFLKPLDAAVGVGVRGYRDTWNIVSQTYELDLEKGLGQWLRLRLEGRYYQQTGAVFWSDDYTGGEPLHGPRGQYFSGDRELSPLRSLMGGGRFTASWHGRPGARVVRLFLDFEASVGADVLKTYLDDFTWAGYAPDDTFAIIASGNLTATF